MSKQSFTNGLLKLQNNYNNFCMVFFFDKRINKQINCFLVFPLFLFCFVREIDICFYLCLCISIFYFFLYVVFFAFFHLDV